MGTAARDRNYRMAKELEAREKMTRDREREALLECLNDQRSHVLGVLKGLSEEDLRRPVLPSGWSCLAAVRHLAVDDERFWFRAVAAGGPLDLNDDTGWQPAPDEPAEAVLDLYRRESAASDAILAVLSLDAARELLDGGTWLGPEETRIPRG